MIKRIICLALSFFLAFSFPVSVFAETQADPSSKPASDSSTTTVPPPAPTSSPEPTSNLSPTPSSSPAANTTGPQSPTGPDSNLYTYNSTTGLWENEHYTWNPTTHQTQPKNAQDYSYNPTTGMWDTTQWIYDTPSGKYIPNVVSTKTAPMPATNQNVSTATGPDSTKVVNTNSQNNALFDLFYDARISHSLNSTTSSGNAAVMGNMIAGSALSGNATDVANILNLLQSSFGLQSAANLLTFTANINGNVVGDLTIDPTQLGPNSLAINNSTAQNNITINSQGSGLIDNKITLGAKSGNSTAENNTTAGNATSGSANAIANVVNILNSAIAAKKSFLGVININGNLDGDILLPPNFIDQLIASNAPHATVNISSLKTNNVVGNLSSNQVINNNINLGAASGSATVDSNTNAGSATTGSGNTSLTIFNLTGRQVSASNSLLVFVNVLGKWVGLIMNAPSGSNAAALGGNVSENKVVENNVLVNEKTNNVINNDINVTAASGNALVKNNTNAGNATSGGATASANIMNIIGSNFQLSDWFGLLFINVLGYWHGSFGVNTDAGNTITEYASQASSNTPSDAPVETVVFGFKPQNKTLKLTASNSSSGSNNSSQIGSSEPSEVVLASAISNDGSNPSTPTTSTNTTSRPHSNSWILPASSFALMMIVIGALGAPEGMTDKLHAYMLSYRLRKN
jgi:hypothetical protein